MDSQPNDDMEYFEALEANPGGDGICSDNDCPCGYPGTKIPRGGGYIYISQAVVEFRRDARTVREAESKIARLNETTRNGSALLLDQNTVTATLMCEQGARKRGLDLEVAAADARYWWKTNLVPLRPTPLAVKASHNVEPGTASPAPIPTPPARGVSDNPVAKKRLDAAYKAFEVGESLKSVLQRCDDLLQLDPGWADVYNLKGMVLEDLNRPVDATAAYREAIRLMPSLSDARDNLDELEGRMEKRPVKATARPVKKTGRRVLEVVLGFILLAVSLWLLIYFTSSQNSASSSLCVLAILPIVGVILLARGFSGKG